MEPLFRYTIQLGDQQDGIISSIRPIMKGDVIVSNKDQRSYEIYHVQHILNAAGDVRETRLFGRKWVS